MSRKKNFYIDGATEAAADIEMPPIGVMPPVLAENPQDWGGNNQQQTEVPDVQPVQLQSEPEQDSDIEDDSNQQGQEEAAEVPQQKSSNRSVAENLRNLREARERAEWERDTLRNQLEQMQRYGQQKQQPVEELPEVEQEPQFDFADDALMEGKQVKKVFSSVNKELQAVKKQLKQFHSQSSEMAVEAKIKAVYPDFDDVVSVENVARLNADYPEIAKTLRDTPDIWNKASSAYSIMKKFGIYRDKSFDEDKMKAIKNAQKPRPVASVNPQHGDSPLSKANAFANGLTPDLRKQMLKEMAEARKNI